MSLSNNIPRNGLEPNPIKPGVFYLPMKAGQHIYEGSIVCMSGGFAVVASTALGLIACGIATQEVDDTGGVVDGAKNVTVRAGVFWCKNSGGDPVAAGDRFSTVYLVDDDTIAKTDNVGTRSPGGVLFDVDSVKGAAVLLCPPGEVGAGSPSALKEAAAALGNPISVPVILSKIANAAVMARLTPGYAGQIRKITFYVIDPATTGAKLATLTPAINGTPVTGGALALTSANCTPIGAKVDGSAITALNAYDANDEITLVGSGVTAFVEGQGVALLFLDPAA